MTEENYNYRTSQALLRNQFPGNGKLKIPIIPMFQEKPGDFDDLLLIGFDKTHLEDQNHLDRMVHFFLYDYRFERVWKNPDNDIEKLSRYPHLGREEDLLPGHTGFPHGTAHLSLIEVTLRGVQRSVPHLQRIQHAPLAFLRRHLIHAIPQNGHLHTV